MHSSIHALSRSDHATRITRTNLVPTDWKGVKRIYFHDNVYYLPLCRLPKPAPKPEKDVVTTKAGDVTDVAATACDINVE